MLAAAEGGLMARKLKSPSKHPCMAHSGRGFRAQTNFCFFVRVQLCNAVIVAKTELQYLKRRAVGVL